MVAGKRGGGMADYQEMYRKLFCAVTEAIAILQNAQRDAEEIYISADMPVVELLRSGSREDEETVE